MVNQSKPNRGPILLVFVGVILIGTAVFYLVFSSSRGRQISSAIPTSSQNEVRIPYANIQRVSLADAQAAFQSGKAVFLDVRGQQYYDQAHISGALSIPEDELPQRFAELNKSDWIITYCT